MSVVEIVSAVLVFAGTLFLLAAAVGVVRFPDFYSRLHAAGKGDTLGQALVLVGLVLLAGASIVSIKLLFIMFFVFILNPTATHALARGAWVCGVRPWLGEKERPSGQREGQMTAADREALYMPIHVEAPAAEEGAEPSTPPAAGSRGEGETEGEEPRVEGTEEGEP